MSSLISGFSFSHAATLRMWFGLAFVGLAVAAHTVQSEEYPFAPDLDILTIQLARSGADWPLPYRLNANVALTRSVGVEPAGSGFSNTPRLLLVTEPKKETVRATSSHWQQTYDGDRISLQRLLSLEFKGALANITFRPSSVLIQGERLRITFRPQSALLEEGRFKITLQPHSASMSWGKTF